MKLVSTADLHGYKWPEFDYVDPKLGFSRRLGDCLHVLEEMARVAVEEGCEYAVIAGDVFHKMGIVEVETYNLIFSGVQKLAETTHVILFRGNHDHADRAGKQHSLIPFAAIKNVTLVDNEIRRLRSFVSRESVDVAFIPYLDDRSKVMAVAKRLAGPPICFTHNGFDGARVGSAVEYLVKEPLSPIQFGKHFGMVYSGHYHALQFVHRNVMYIGSPMEHTRSDVTGETKGIIVIDTDKPNKPKFIPLGLPRFIKVEGSIWKPLVQGNFIDFQLVKDQKADEVSADLHKYGARGVRTIPYAEPEEAKPKSQRRLRVKAGMSMTDIVKQAARKRHGDLDRERLEKVMLEILREAEQR